MVLSEKVKKEIVWSAKNRPVYLSALPIYDCYKLKENIKPEAFRKQLGYSENDIILLFFGYVRKYKGLNILIESLPDIIKKNSRIRLLIVGEFYDSSEKYYNQINQLNLKENVKVVDKFVPNEDVGNYYSICDIVILPYLEGTQSGVLNIAYGFKKPVIVTKVGGLTEDVDEGKTGFITEPGNSKLLSDCVLKFLKLRDMINFESNIEKKLSENEFNKLPELIEKILKDIKNAD
jgi:glycosyltransferase involved in cell wall biosynthesis